MNAKEAILRIAVRAILDPDLDLSSIPNIDKLTDQLKEYCPEFFVAGFFEETGEPDHLSKSIPVRQSRCISR